MPSKNILTIALLACITCIIFLPQKTHAQSQDVHRFWSESYKHHFYTISEQEKDLIIQNDPNWSYEGVAYKAFTKEQADTANLHRFYSEEFKGHFYTKSEQEKQNLIDNDPNWSYEGVAFHVKNQGTPIYRFYSTTFKGHFYTRSEQEKQNLIDNDPNWGYEGIAFYIDTNTPAPICGDSQIQSPEQCDDGNTTGGDGCSSMCLFEDVTNDCPQNHADDGAACIEIRSIAQWEALFQAKWAGELVTWQRRSSSGDSWDHYWLAYVIDANEAMFRATEDTQYLDRALLYIDNVMTTAQPSSAIPTSQFQDEYMAWANHSHSSLGDDGREYALFESYLWRYITSVLRTMKERPAIYNDPAYREQYDTILAFAQTHIWEKWYSRGTPNLYRGRAHMATHWARIAMNLYLLNDDATQNLQYKTVLDNIDHAGMSSWSGASLRGQMQPHPTQPDAIYWSDRWTRTTAPFQDVSHGNNVLSYIVQAHDINYQWTDTDIDKLTILLDKVIWPEPLEYAYYVDGSEEGNGWFTDGFLKLGRYDVHLQKRIEGSDVLNNTQFFGNGALNAKYLLDPPTFTISF